MKAYKQGLNCHASKEVASNPEIEMVVSIRSYAALQPSYTLKAPLQREYGKILEWILCSIQ